MAERQDFRLVKAILDYRNAKHAIELINGGDKGAAELARHPHLMELLLEITRAQGAGQATADDVLALVKRDEDGESE